MTSKYRIRPSKPWPSARRIAERTTIVNCLAVGTVCILLSAGRATAHPEFSQVTTNRYLKLDLIGDGEVRLAYSVLYGAAPAFAERRRADANQDATLDAAETRAMGERLRADVLAHLKLSVDGRPVQPAFEPAAVGLAGPEVGPSPFSVDLVARIPCPGAPPHTLVLDDTTNAPELGETEIRVEESPATRLLESHRGPGPGPRESQILFRGPRFSALEDRSVTIRFDGRGVAAPSTDERHTMRTALLGLGLLMVAGALFWVVRRYRSMKG